MLSCLFVFTVTILLLRPAIIFSSNTIQSSLITGKSKSQGIVKIVKKRRDSVRIGNMISREVEAIAVVNKHLLFSLFAINQLLRKLLFALSLLLSAFGFLIRRRATFFEIVPDNRYYLGLSVIRI